MLSLPTIGLVEVEVFSCETTGKIVRVEPGHRPRLCRDPQNLSLLHFPNATSPACSGFPNVPLRGKVGSIIYSHTQSIHFLSYLVFLKPNIPISSLKEEKIVRNDPRVEELS